MRPVRVLWDIDVYSDINISVTAYFRVGVDETYNRTRQKCSSSVFHALTYKLSSVSVKLLRSSLLHFCKVTRGQRVPDSDPTASRWQGCKKNIFAIPCLQENVINILFPPVTLSSSV